MIYSLLVRTRHLGELQFDVKLQGPTKLLDYIVNCIDNHVAVNLTSTDNVKFLITYEVLSTSIIEVYEKDEIHSG